MCTYSLVPITLASQPTKPKDATEIRKYSVVACFDTYNHYPAKLLSQIDIKLYFFQIVKERNSFDL